MKIGESLLTQEFRKMAKDENTAPISNETKEMQKPVKEQEASKLSENEKAQELKRIEKKEESIQIDESTKDKIKEFQQNLDKLNQQRMTDMYSKSSPVNPLF